MNLNIGEKESEIESDICDFAKIRGWLEVKFVSPQLRGVMDRFFIRRGRVVFMEVKKPGEEPTMQQMHRIREFRAHGGEVHWVDNLEDARRILR